MRMYTRRPFNLFLSLVVASSLVVSTGLVLAASPGDGHLKRHGATMASQPQGQPDPELLPLWAAFVGKVSGPVSVTWSHLWGTPKAVYGTLSDPIAVSEASARQFLSTHAALLKLDPSLPGFTLASSRETPMGQVYAFTQAANGVPVYGAELTVHFNREGRVVGLTNTSVPSAKLGAIAPSVKAEQAVESARSHVPPGPVDEHGMEDLPVPSTRLVIYAETDTPTLAWEVIVYTPGPTWQLFVHAQKGDVLAPARDLNRYATGTGQVFLLVNAVVATRNNTLRDNKDAASAVPPSAYQSVRLLGLDGTGLLDGSYASQRVEAAGFFSKPDICVRSQQ
jgi:hypothetical protein